MVRYAMFANIVEAKPFMLGINGNTLVLFVEHSFVRHERNSSLHATMHDDIEQSHRFPPSVTHKHQAKLLIL